MCASKENFDCQQTTLQSYDCEHCIFKSHLRVAFYNHLRRCHANLPKFSGLARPKSDFSLKWYSCKICKQFTTCSALHLLKHEVGWRKDCASGLGKKKIIFKMLKCLHCSYKTSRKDLLRKHIMAQHLWFKCDRCNYKGKMKTYLMRHIALHHRDNVPGIYCNFCGHKTKTMNEFKKHMKRSHSQWKKFDCQKATLENYECNFCDFKTHLRIVLHYHMSRCHDTLPKNKKNYIVKIYDCIKCNQFTSSSALHKLKHEDECLDVPIIDMQNPKKLKCAYCLYETRYKSYLKQHMFTHFSLKVKTDLELNKKYKCTHCSYEAFKQLHLEQHIITKHTTLEDNECYKCSWCDYKGKVKSDLMNHIKINHTNIAWYKCDNCEYKTRWKTHLTRHINSRHTPDGDAIWYQCNYCEYKTKTKFALKKHVAVKHCNS